MAKMGKIPTPLEAVDTAADVVSQVFSTPARVGGKAFTAIGQTFNNLNNDIARPREYSEIPPPPGVLVSPAVDGVGHIVGGVVDTVKGAIDGVVETVDGVRREITNFVGR